MSKKYLIAVLGPTAVGKTSVSIELAKMVGAEIVSCDSRQFYHHIPIGTAQATKAERAEVPHHFVNCLPLSTVYSAGKFENDAIGQIEKLHQHSNAVILTGGSGLYVNAVLYGLDDLPNTTDIVRNELNNNFEQLGIKYLQDTLKNEDPAYFEIVDIHNARRLIRALEIKLTTGKSILHFQQKNKKKRNFETIIIGLNRDRESLYDRINLRVDLMLEEGLLEEAKSVYKFREHNALQTVGYKELFDYFEGKIDFEEAIRLIKRNSRRYAKRQLTWLRKQENIQWFEPNELTEIFTFVHQKMR